MQDSRTRFLTDRRRLSGSGATVHRRVGCPDGSGNQGQPSGTTPTCVLLHLVPLSRRGSQVVKAVAPTREIAEAVEGVGLPLGGLGVRQCRGGAVPALAGPCGVLSVHEAKRIALPPSPGQLPGFSATKQDIHGGLKAL